MSAFSSLLSCLLSVVEVMEHVRQHLKIRWRQLVCCILLGGIGNAAYAYQVVDERGVAVDFSQVPQRIISMLPSLTETVCAFDACARLVGVDRYSNWPGSVAALPHLGGLDDANVEAIVALRPDVVLVSRSARITARLESLGLKVLVLEPKNQADVKRVLTTIGLLLQVNDDGSVWRHIDAAVDAAAASLSPAARDRRVYFEVNRAPYAAGASSFIGETLTRLGVGNIVPPELGPFPKLNPEFVVRANPDLIMIGDQNAASLADRPGWLAIDAVRNKRICVFTQAQSDILVRPGPRMAEAARIMADCLRRFAPAA
jgi:iron complex transport system substrate-binding protein